LLAFQYTWGALAFWSPRAAEEVNSSTWDLIHQLSPFPLEGLATGVLLSLVTVVPVGLVAWYPARVLLGIDVPTWAIAIVPAAATFLLGLTSWMFARGMQHYGHTGSTRYLAHGHRK
jgi:ABC-2 type transport system permease protein